MYKTLSLWIAFFSISIGIILSYLHTNGIGLSFASPPALSNFPQCSEEDYKNFREQLSSYPLYYKDKREYGKSVNIAGYKELKGECAFAQTYKEARKKFLEAAKKVPNAVHTSYEIVEGQDLYTDVVEIPGDKDYFLVSTSGVHGPEGYAGSGTQISLLEILTSSPEMI